MKNKIKEIKQNLENKAASTLALAMLPFCNVLAANGDETDFAEKSGSYVSTALKIILVVLLVGLGLGILTVAYKAISGQLGELQGFIDKFKNLGN